MPCITYVDRKFSDASLDLIRTARRICQDYADQGYDLTLRQLYYQFVARDLIPNKDTEYKRLGSVINDARLAGLLDWDFIVDRTRNLRSLAHWDDPASLVSAAAEQFRMDKWAAQGVRIEVWIEKDALVGVLESCCPGLDVPYFSCRGYTSQSEVWGAAQRLGRYIANGQRVVVLHLGDHDPSGIDMTRDVADRLAMFIAQDLDICGAGEDAETYAYELGEELTIERIALNMEQVRAYDPPPNPAKLTDSRGRGYISRFGRSSWELDALDPATLVGLITNAVESHRDADAWNEAVRLEESEREVLTAASADWAGVKDYLERDE